MSSGAGGTKDDWSPGGAAVLNARLVAPHFSYPCSLLWPHFERSEGKLDECWRAATTMADSLSLLPWSVYSTLATGPGWSLLGVRSAVQLPPCPFEFWDRSAPDSHSLRS